MNYFKESVFVNYIEKMQTVVLFVVLLLLVLSLHPNTHVCQHQDIQSGYSNHCFLFPFAYSAKFSHAAMFSVSHSHANL